MVAPVWVFAWMATAGGLGAWQLAAAPGLACGVLLGLPGTTTARGLLEPPSGGDEAEPSAAIRAISGLAHHGWLGAWAAAVALTLTRRGEMGPFLGWTVAALLFLLVLRAVALGLAGARAGGWLLAGAVALPLVVVAFGMIAGAR
jgi:hypothetical protein